MQIQNIKARAFISYRSFLSYGVSQTNQWCNIQYLFILAHTSASLIKSVQKYNHSPNIVTITHTAGLISPDNIESMIRNSGYVITNTKHSSGILIIWQYDWKCYCFHFISLMCFYSYQRWSFFTTLYLSPICQMIVYGNCSLNIVS